MAAFTRPPVAALKSPYLTTKIGRVKFTVGTEAVDAINVALQFQTQRFRDLTYRGRVRAWLSEDATGDTPVRAHLMPSGGLAIGTDGTLVKNRLMEEGLMTDGNLAIDAVPEKFKTTQIAVYKVGGLQYTKAATTALVFTAAHVVNANTFGVVLVQINAAGTVSTKVPLATQLYASAALALAALPAPDAGNVALGYIAIANNAGDWTANTDDLTNASDVTTAAFVDAPENGQFTNDFDIISEADGDADVTITHVGIRTFYLNVQLPDGSILTSGAVTFA